MLRPADQHGEVAKLFSKCKEYFIFIIDSLCEEWNELGAGAFDAERQRNRRELLNGVQPQLDKFKTFKYVIMLNVIRLCRCG